MYRVYCKTCGEYQFCSSTKVREFECRDCFDKREEREKQDMEQRLQELKEKITSFVRDYNIESIDILIRKDEILPTKVNLEIRV